MVFQYSRGCNQWEGRIFEITEIKHTHECYNSKYDFTVYTYTCNTIKNEIFDIRFCCCNTF